MTELIKTVEAAPRPPSPPLRIIQSNGLRPSLEKRVLRGLPMHTVSPTSDFLSDLIFRMAGILEIIPSSAPNRIRSLKCEGLK